MTHDARVEKIFKSLAAAQKYLKDLGYTPFLIAVQGSQNYNMDSYTAEYQSDIDLKAYVLPSFENVYRNEKVSKVFDLRGENDISHLEIKDVRLLIDMLAKMNTSYLELLVTDYYITDYKGAVNNLRDLVNDLMKERFTLFVKAVYGMAKEKEKAFSHPYPGIIDKIEKHGYDPKQLHHIVRLDYLLFDVLKDSSSYSDTIKCKTLSTKELKELKELKTTPLVLSEAEALRDVTLRHIKQMYDSVKFEEHLIESDALNKVRKIVEDLVKNHMTRLLAVDYGDADARLIKAPYSALPKEAKAYVDSLALGITEIHMVEVLRFTLWQIQNHWEK